MSGEGKAIKKVQKLAKDDAELYQKQVGKAQSTQLKAFEYDFPTVSGDKKNISGAWPPAYNPEPIEKHWYEYWRKMGFFKPYELSNPHKFIIMIPPPNVTGQLHIGHALTNAVQDALTRYYRCSGYCTEWLPGLDHAGISCQVVVEKQLKKAENKSRYDLGREEFTKRIWQWKTQYGNKIMNQLERLGSSLDWDRQVFTLDERRTRAHNAAFKRFFDEGLIYRDNRLVGWDCSLQTAISDVEIEYIQITEPIYMEVGGKKYPFGYLWQFGYPVITGDLEQKTDEEISAYFDEKREEMSATLLQFATTRPETMIGDSALAIHPEDERYAKFHGKYVYHPIRRCRIPIVCDSTLVDMNFGTGVVKITPAHDPNDFEAGKRNGLPMINMLRDDGTCLAPGTRFDHMPRLDARIDIIRFFSELGLFFGKTKNPMAVGLSQRSHDPVEPMLKPQWYLNCESMAKMALDAVNSQQLLIVPKQHETTWRNYLENIRPWCISRQLWWGHYIPLYKVWLKTQEYPNGMDHNDYVYAETDEDAYTAAETRLGVSRENLNIQRDPDVTDTWFSSALFPFSAYEWPEDSLDLQSFFPGSVLETGHDILFFWVARMVMTSLYLTNKLPFREVYLHAMVRDSKGEKMSKSKGNVVDPLDCINGISLQGMFAKLREGNLSDAEIKAAERLQKAEFPSGIAVCGTDALRMALCLLTGYGRSVNLDINKIIAQRNFCNKIFNSVKFTIDIFKVDQMVADTYGSAYAFLESLEQQSLNLAQRFILYRLCDTIYRVNKAMRQYQMSDAAQAVLSFWWDDLCDKFIEIVKPDKVLLNQQILLVCVDLCLRMIHPFMPFLAEEMFQHIPRWADERELSSIMIAPFPRDCKWFNFGAPEEYQRYDELLVDEGSIFTRIRKQYSDALALVDRAIEIVHQLRVIRSYYRLAVSTKLSAFACGTMEDEVAAIVTVLAGLETLELKEIGYSKPFCGCAIIDSSLKVLVNLEGLVDFAKEKALKEKELSYLDQQIARLYALVESANYDRIPEEIRAQNVDKMADMYAKRIQLLALLEEYANALK